MRRMTAAALALLCVLLPRLVLAQGAILQSGPVTAGHPAAWFANGVLGDAGPATNGLLSQLGVTQSGTCGIGLNSGPVTSAYVEVCLGFGAGQAQLSVTPLAGNGATPLNIIDPAGVLVNGAIVGTVNNYNLTEPGSVASPQTTWPNPFSGTDYVLYNLTNSANNQKRAIHCFEATTSIGTVSQNTQAECLNIFVYSPSGVNNSTFGSSTTVNESSGAYIVQAGGGNALTAYNLCGQTPSGYHNYCSDGVPFQGFAIETGCDGIRACFWTQAYSAGGQAANIGWTTSANGVPTPSYGAAFFPSGTCNGTDRALTFQTKNFVEKAYVDDCGDASFVSMNNLNFYNNTSQAMSFTGCGTGAAFDGNATKNAGSFTVGSGASSCSIKFPTNAFKSYIHCRVTSQGTAGVAGGFTYNYITTGISVSASSNLAGDNIDYECDGA